MVATRKKNLLYIAISCIVLWLLTHGYRFMNNIFTCDSLIEVFQDDILFQRSLGRFMHPLVMVLRGTICSPWLIGCVSLILMILSAFLLAEILKIENPLSIFIMCGILICNNTMICSAAGFLPWMDVYMAALFLAVLGVWLFQKNKIYTYIAGCFSLACSMGFYQAYIDVAITLLVMLVIVNLAEKKEIKKSLITAAKYIGGLIASGVLYLIIYKGVCKLHHIEETSSYHGMADVGNYENVSIVDAFIITYKKFVELAFKQETFVSTYLAGINIQKAWVVLLNVCLVVSALIIIGGLIYLNVKNKIPFYQILLQIIGLFIIPFSINFVCFISKGVAHHLMTFAFSLIYVFALWITTKIFNSSDEKTEENSNDKSTKNKYKNIWLKSAFIIPLILFIWNGIVYGNQLYFKIDMSDRAALSFATRMIDDIEDVDGYVAGVTPVAFVGTPERSDYMLPVIYLKDVKDSTWNTPFAYDISLPYYMQIYMDVKINPTNSEIPAEVLSGMPNYPQAGSMKFYGDTLVVKVSD